MGELPKCRLVGAGAPGQSPQGLPYAAGISRETVGAQRLCMHLSIIPPGGRARAHAHPGHETAVYLISGAIEVWSGERLEDYCLLRAGDFFYIPAGVPHLPANASQTERCLAVIARTDPADQEHVALLPALEECLVAAAHHQRAADR